LEEEARKSKTEACDKAQNQSLRFDGRTTYIDVPRPVQDDFTISFWFKPENAGKSAEKTKHPTDKSTWEKWWVYYTALVDAEVPADVDDFGITWGGGAVHFGIGNPAMSIHVKDKVAVNNWHHVAATRVKSTGKVELYVDGVLGS